MKTKFVPFTKEIQGSVHRSRKMRNPNSKIIKYIFKYLEISVDFPDLMVTDAMRGSSSDSLSSDGSLISKRVLTYEADIPYIDKIQRPNVLKQFMNIEL